jgi:hypothetical protein
VRTIGWTATNMPGGTENSHVSQVRIKYKTKKELPGPAMMGGGFRCERVRYMDTIVQGITVEVGVKKQVSHKKGGRRNRPLKPTEQG